MPEVRRHNVSKSVKIGQVVYYSPYALFLVASPHFPTIIRFGVHDARNRETKREI